jgi:hypothetical protein
LNFAAKLRLFDALPDKSQEFLTAKVARKAKIEPVNYVPANPWQGMTSEMWLSASTHEQEGN